MAEALVTPALLRYIDDYIGESDINDAIRHDGLESDSNLIVFYRELFARVMARSPCKQAVYGPVGTGRVGLLGFFS